MLRLSLAAGFHILACTATPRGARTFASAMAAGGATHTVAATTVSAPNGHKDIEAYVFTPSLEKHTATMILTHGLGDTALGWTDAVQYFYAPALPHFKFVLPVRRTRACSRGEAGCARCTVSQCTCATCTCTDCAEPAGYFEHGHGDAVMGTRNVAASEVTLRMTHLLHGFVQYDIVGLSDRYQEKCDGIEDSRNLLLHLIDQVHCCVPARWSALELTDTACMPPPLPPTRSVKAAFPWTELCLRDSRRAVLCRCTQGFRWRTHWAL